MLSVAATGAGKTCMAGEIIRHAGGRVLFLADAKQLVYQAADKLAEWAGIIADVEMGKEHAQCSAPLIVATTQSICNRLEKYPQDAFALIIVDEAHRNTLGAQAQSVFNYFKGAQVVGLTATPFRSDKKELGSFYQTTAKCDAGLIRLIKEGWLSRITIKTVSSGIKVEDVRSAKGDFVDSDIDRVISPHLDKLARILAEHASNRRTVAFLPLIDTSRRFVAACLKYGLRAVHVDGDDRDGVDHFKSGEPGVICNAQLLGTGWDEPCVDCIYPITPTKSFSRYSQQTGRGTRLFPGKKDLLLLDPLFISDTLPLIKPARLIARTDDEAYDLTKAIEAESEIDLFEAEAKAVIDREKRMKERLAEAVKKKSKTVDAVEFALALDDDVLANYEPETGWESERPSNKQLIRIENAGFDTAQILYKGQASRLIDLLEQRREMGLATPKQLKWLVKFGYTNANQATFAEANAFLDRKFNKAS